ncbi:Starch-binding associating with outer membrane [Reichenbachiella faecimaris]|uniref:Starch-binding associating with outer membrane n=1 Tax=Reichenbachiella faecimaris TaxID=692418 RepID=A0A1W2GJZ3_REIFA|nr:SusD/RagB family nutrient-binding outer membrane lipoprotein [Reichenbachiella faecimaris]SMD36901.1 Starch-binding associating with outer membrane [Reichenbachiella faecimaris]
MKKYINKLMIVLATFGLMALGACDDYLDINNDPTQVVDPDPNFTLTSGIIDIAYFHTDAYGLAASYWVQYVTQAGNVAGVTAQDQYQVLPGDNAYQRDFNGLYSGPIQDLVYTSEEGLVRDQTNVAAIAELVKAYTFHSLVDMFDQVPYAQANKIDEFPNPVYDDGQDIYDDLIIKIDAAIDAIDPLSIEAVTGDIIFGGNMNRWVEFANTLKLKIYLRQTEARTSVAQSGVESLDGEAFLSSDALMAFDQSNPSNRHPAELADIGTQSFNAASGTIGNHMLNTNDPRIDVYFRRPIDTTDDPAPAVIPHQFIDQANGPNVTGPDAGLSYYSARGDYMIGTGSAFPYFTATESSFLQAEAALRGWITTGTAQEFYEQGIRDSFASAGLSGADAWIAAEAPYPTGGTFDAQLEAIMTAKWIALIRQPLEMWNEWKRTGYPSTTPATPVAGQVYIDPSPASLLPAGEFALRFPPTLTEATLNENTPDVVSLSTPVWWDM